MRISYININHKKGDAIMRDLSIRKVLRERDGLTAEEAQERFLQAKEDLMKRIGEDDVPMDFCAEEFGLEPDYLDDLLY